MVYIMYMYVNKHVELAQWGIALLKMYLLLFYYYISCEKRQKYTQMTVPQQHLGLKFKSMISLSFQLFITLMK